MDNYNPDTCFSSIDHMGRYAYKSASYYKMNLARFACLLSLINQRKIGIKKATDLINKFDKKYEGGSV